MRYMVQHRSGRVVAVTSAEDGAPRAVVSSADGVEVVEVDMSDDPFDASRLLGEDVATVLGQLRIKTHAEVGSAEKD
ncbi:hypothetical protein ACPW96_00060 [Micromonospora sp. DT81.3]|uniref:hypothetical protein n=1 Tax=Micromonospora sp. DT81.3 TaxID=3416523 RepID=UPI003CE6DEE5